MQFGPNDAPAIKCAQCGERLFVPEWSEYVDEYRVRHIWKCEPCHYSFEATIASRRRSVFNKKFDGAELVRDEVAKSLL